MEPIPDSKSLTKPGLVSLGFVIGAHGLAGELRFRLHDPASENLSRVPTIALAKQLEDPAPPAYRIQNVRPGRKGEARVRLEGIESREQAEELKGRIALADPEYFEKLESDEWYAYQLTGCRVETRAGKALGTVQEIWPTGGHDVLVVATGGEPVLIPAVRQFLAEVDIGERRIVVDVIPGLIDSD